IGIEPGDLRGLAETGAWLCYAFSEIARLMRKKALANWLGTLSMRLKHGTPEELLQLVSIRGAGRIRAKVLVEAGYRTVKDIAEATPRDLERLPGIGRCLSKEIIEQARSMIHASSSD
ncbi:MAG: helix-hairpin-helix domain-containing protein, partial [Candidatus Korarchaeota archaeon]|nr:helix-hairpin-helix domain-containing protein [Candidatus Korarchaeota archaeon]